MLGAVLIAAALPVCDLATNAVAQRIAGADPAKCLCRFLDYPPDKGKLGFPRCLFQDPFPPNPDFWLKDVDFSCVSPWNDSCGALRAGTLISKRHIVCAAHFALRKGVRILFTDNDVGVCPCHIAATKVIDGTDIQVAALDADVTPNIRPARILPDDYATYIGNGKGLPVVTFNQHEEAFLTELTAISTNATSRFQGSRAPADKSRTAFRKPIVVGDSGNPAFLLVGKEPILLYCLKYGGSGSGPALHRYRREIQAAMDELCPGHKLESFDFKASLR